jgi:hypothetical protein
MSVAYLVLAIVLLVVALPLLLLVVRRRALLRRGAFDCGLRRVGASSRWTLGFLVVRRDELRWHRALAPWRSRRVLVRDRLVVTGQRRPQGGESLLFPPRTVVMQCRDGEEPLELALPDGGVTGLLAWLSAGPPGSR